MSFMRSALGRALGGAGAAAAGIASRYIDDEIRTNREQFLTDLAHNNRVKLDQYQLSDARQAQVRKNATDATMSQGAAQRASQMAGINDADYQAALDTESGNTTRRKVDSEKAVIDGTSDAKINAEKKAIEALTPAKIAAEKALLEGTMGEKAKQAGLIARATDMDAGNRAARAALLNMEVGDRKRLGKLYDDYLAVVNDEQTPDEQKAQKLRPITNAIQALKMKSSPAGAGRDPELDVATTKEFTRDQDGNVISETTTRSTRRPGQMPERQTPSEDPVLAEARAAIARGADPAKVEERLKKMGKTLQPAK